MRGKAERLKKKASRDCATYVQNRQCVANPYDWCGLSLEKQVRNSLACCLASTPLMADFRYALHCIKHLPIVDVAWRGPSISARRADLLAGLLHQFVLCNWNRLTLVIDL
jgi:hypothetical protein